MKIKIDGEYKEISFWSFLKAWVLSWLFMVGLFLLILFIIGVIVS
jgi:hypothetical protein